MSGISPGVYTKITDLSTYVQQIPGTIGCTVGLTKRGPDNEFVFLGGPDQYLMDFGEPNIEEYGRNFSQGPYIAYNFLKESAAMYWIRLMPEDASYSNLRINVQLEASDLSPTLTIDYLPITSANTKTELRTELENWTSGGLSQKPLCIFYPVGRGDFYNSYSIRISKIANPMTDGVYNLDIYEIQSDGSNVIVESFEVSFDPTAKDRSGGSIFIESVLETYSKILRVAMEKANGEYTDGYKLLIKTYDQNIGIVTIDSTAYEAGAAILVDDKQDFSEWETTDATAFSNYMVIAKDDKGNQIGGWLGATTTTDEDTIAVFNSRNLATATQAWIDTDDETPGYVDATLDQDDLANFNFESTDITYVIKKCNGEVPVLFPSVIPKSLKKGSDGSLVDEFGDFDSDVAETLLTKAFSGTLVSPSFEGGYVDQITDTEFVYFSMLFDAGYPADVKTKISALAVNRGDCMAIVDNGDNVTAALALTKRQDVNDFNTYHTAIFEPFSKVDDGEFTGRDIWVSPIYHMASILPRNDRLTEIWNAAAGFDYILDSIKELRFSPRSGERDKFYLKQINPLVKFREGIAPFSQLTTQSKASAMQDINIVRLVLYAKVALARYCRYFLFKQNDSLTWSAVAKDITEFLQEIQSKRGLDSFNVEVSATEYEKKQKKFHVNIILEPTRTTERIDLNFFIK